MKEYYKWIKVKCNNPDYDKFYDYYEYYVPQNDNISPSPNVELVSDSTYFERVDKGDPIPNWIKGEDF